MGDGFPNPFDPFGFDLNEIMRMLQSPGPVNMEVARADRGGDGDIDVETGEARPSRRSTPTTRARSTTSSAPCS